MPEDRKRFELGDYVEVKDRIKLFYELYAGGRLVTKSVKMLTAPDGTQRVLVRALAYRTVDDPLPGVGSSWLQIPGATPYTKGSEVENAETSAWGRAIGALGILIDRSIATSNEIDNKAGEANRQAPPSRIVGTREHPVPDLSRTPEGGLIGIAAVKERWDFNLRQSETSEGWVLPFRIKTGGSSSGFSVIAEGALAEALDAIKATVIDQRVTVWGHWTDETTPAKGTRPKIEWRLLHLERIATPDGILPAPAFDGPVSEAPTIPLFDPDEPALPEPPPDLALVGEQAS